MIDPYFRVKTISATPNPQLAMFRAMRQDYIEEFVSDRYQWEGQELVDTKTGEVWTEDKAGHEVIRCLLNGGKGHFGPLEHPQITFNVGWFPHSTMQQLRTHRIASFDVQSFRYSGKRIIEVAEGKRDIDEVFYLRPVGEYSDRQGKRYQYTENQRRKDLDYCLEACWRYKKRIEQGFAEEHARGLIPFDIRQHWVMSFNLRSLMHLLTIRGKKDAQLECQQICELILPHLEAWCPEVYEWFFANLWLKGKLAP